MKSPKKILIVIDPTSPSQPALERIAHLPGPPSAQLMLLICDYEPNLGIGEAVAPAAIASARAALLARHRRALEALATPLRENRGLDVLTDVRWDYPLHEAIIRKAVEWRADLVVKDTHHHSLLRRSLFSNTDWSLIQQCPVPLLLVKPRTIGHVACVVAAVDPVHTKDKAASLDERIVTAAEEMSHLFGGQTHVLHAFDVSPFLLTATDGVTIAPTTFQIAELTASLEKASSEAVHALTDRLGIPRERVHVVQGRARDVLVSSTEQLRADVVVMGAVSRSVLERVFVGGTAEAVLEKLGCDLLIVKPAEGA